MTLGRTFPRGPFGALKVLLVRGKKLQGEKARTARRTFPTLLLPAGAILARKRV